MKLQIDTELKTIKIEREIKFSDLIDVLDKLFPENSWREYKLIIEPINNFASPIIIYPNYPYQPWVTNPTYVGDNINPLDGGIQLLNENNITTLGTNTIYNIEIQN